MDSDDEFDLETSRPLPRIRTSQASSISSSSQKSIVQQNKSKQKTKRNSLQFVQQNNSQFKVPSQSRVITKNDKNHTNVNKKNNGNLKKANSFSGSPTSRVNNVSSNASTIQSQPNGLQNTGPRKWKRKSSDGDLGLEKVKKSRSDDGNCPFCQMPWSNYISSGRKKDFHNFTCLDKSLDDLKSCPASLLCSATDEGHFWSYQHIELALHREEQERASHR
ncbi:unnamed protein product, partial [Meganyctiphanes norvegica]